jgi:hypothetical protein
MSDTPRCTYWAVPCRTCGGMIAVAYVESDLQGKTIDFPAKPDPFEADCALCGKRNAYGKYEVTPWEGPLPAPSFKNHSAFLPNAEKEEELKRYVKMMREAEQRRDEAGIIKIREQIDRVRDELKGDPDKQ